MEKKPILIVDDEKNIRLTLSQSLKSLGVQVQTAVNGEEALQKLQGDEFGIILLDLKMPGMEGMDVLQMVRRKWPKIRVIIITAHGTIESAVEAMKLGAVDFIQKPFVPYEIRELVTKVQEREALTQESAVDYRSLIELTKRYISDENFAAAQETVQKAIAMKPGQAEAYNMLGALFEIKGDLLEAQKFYRTAFNIDPTYKPAWANLDRTTSWKKQGRIDLGPDKSESISEEKSSKDESDEK